LKPVVYGKKGPGTFGLRTFIIGPRDLKNLKKFENFMKLVLPYRQQGAVAQATWPYGGNNMALPCKATGRYRPSRVALSAGNV